MFDFIPFHFYLIQVVKVKGLYVVLHTNSHNITKLLTISKYVISIQP